VGWRWSEPGRRLALPLGSFFMYTGIVSDQSIPVDEKKRGRPKGSAFAEPIPVRLTPDQVGAVERWSQGLITPVSRSEGVRQLVACALEIERMDPATSAGLDAWIEAQPDPKPSRPEAIRRLLEKALGREV
jgi:hypothetical protein